MRIRAEHCPRQRLSLHPRAPESVPNLAVLLRRQRKEPEAGICIEPMLAHSPGAAKDWDGPADCFARIKPG